MQSIASGQKMIYLLTNWDVDWKFLKSSFGAWYSNTEAYSDEKSHLKALRWKTGFNVSKDFGLLFVYQSCILNDRPFSSSSRIPRRMQLEFSYSSTNRAILHSKGLALLTRRWLWCSDINLRPTSRSITIRLLKDEQETGPKRFQACYKVWLKIENQSLKHC